MTEKQWNDLEKIIKGELLSPLPVGFIIDCPWLPNWYGIDILDYFTNDELWFKANAKAIETFPEIMFLPGFWSEFGMCSEPTAFGARCSFPKNKFPHVYKSINSIEDINLLAKPNAETDGFAPFLLNRLALYQSKVQDLGHEIKFSVTRGPLNIASYLMGTTELLTNMMLYPEEIHKLLNIITEYLIDWHELQRSTFSTIDGIFILDDIIGFVGEQEFTDFVFPYLKRIYSCDVSVKFLHNDSECGVSMKYLPELGINLFNMGYDTSLNELKNQSNDFVTMMGNIPPRDVLANGSKDDIVKTCNKLLQNLESYSKVVFSCGGGMPPNVSTENIKVFYSAINSFANNK